MPTPVNTARQCLTQESSSALDEAVAVARRRGHAQTTSLHMVSSLLSLPNSCLREACTRARNVNAYSTRVQFKALELSLSVSLDRMTSSSQSSSRVEEPPVSNSLMAAIKRSQANQRRQPENFNFYQQQQQQQQYSSGTVPVVKVELQNLILSILDDPLVSRVFGEAGFRSCDVKMATLRPGINGFHHPHHLFGGYTTSSRYNKRPVPPLFLCNSEVGSTKGFSFPFMGCFSEDENSRRICEVMVRNRKRNPLLLGISAADALRGFLQTMQRSVEGVLPVGLSGLRVICVKDEILRLVNGDCDEGPLESRFDEVESILEKVRCNGVLLSFGDLGAFAVDGIKRDGLGYLVRRFKKLLDVHGGKLWLIGAAVTYEVYFKLLNKFPSIDEDWDLEIFPVTSLQFSMGGSYPRSSLMESFVPLGGFFSMPSDTRSPLSNAGNHELCNKKYEQEVNALSNGGLRASVAENCQSNLPSWLQIVQPNAQSGFGSTKATDDRLLQNAKISGLQKKWDGICQHHHGNQTSPKGYQNHLGYQFSRVMGFQVADEKKESAISDSRNHSNASSIERGNKNVLSNLSTELAHSTSLKGLNSPDMPSNNKNRSILSSSDELPPERRSDQGCLKSPTSVTSVTTDLGLGICSASARREQVSGSLSAKADAFACSISNHCFDNHNHFNVKDPKLLYKALVERVSRQEEAISAVVRAFTRRQTKSTDVHGTSRGDVWISFRGPDRISKRRIGVALAEALYGNMESLIYVDLSFQDEMIYEDKLFNPKVINKFESKMRVTVVDYLVEKLSKKPSVVFLENIDKADKVLQNSLSHAIKTGRFMDFHGKDVSTNNSIFLATTRSTDLSSHKSAKYPEEDILTVKGHLIEILIRFDLNDDPMSDNLHQSNATQKGCSDLVLMNKRKVIGGSRSTDQRGSLNLAKKAHKAPNFLLDLNFPAEGSEICNTNSSEYDSDSTSENSRSWLENFEGQSDEIVAFEPFDFDTLSEKLLKDITECFYKIVGSKCSIEIELDVMQQILAAAYLSDNKRVEDWIQLVLRQGFMEANGCFSLDPRSIVKLVSRKGTCSEDLPEGLLPDRIIIN